MFAAYSGNNRKNDRNQKDERVNINDRTRCAVQTSASRKFDRQTSALEKKREREVIQQFGYGESSSDEDCGGIRVAIPTAERQNSDEVFTLPEKRKQMEAKQQIQEARERMTAGNPYASFPSSSKSIPNASSRNNRGIETMEISDNDRSSSGRPERRRNRSRESHRDRRDRSRDRSHKKKKKHRRRSSSSSSSSGSRYSRRRSPSPKRKKPAQKIKYGFLTDNDFNSRDSLASQVVYREVTADYENYSIGQSKNEIAACYIGVRFIDGLKHNPDFFNAIYGRERLQPKLENHKFHDLLVKVAKHVPREKFFRGQPVEDGYWKVTGKSDIMNELNEDGEHSQLDDVVHHKLTELKKAYKDNMHGVADLIAWLELEDEIQRSDSGAFVRSEPRAHLERKLAIVDTAVKNNPMNVIVHLMQIELMIALDENPNSVNEKYCTLVFRFPHEPMAWIRYLDYVQYNSSFYSPSLMDGAFEKCLEVAVGLVQRTFISHVRSVSDWPQYQLFHFTVYLRFLKWQMATGRSNIAMANIQATFELNFGTSKSMTAKDRMAVLFQFWKSELPRIGDEDGLGAEKMLTMFENETEERKSEMEMAAYDIYFHDLVKAKDEIFEQAAHTSEAWVAFERKMNELETRVKRTDMLNNRIFTEDYQDNISGLELTDPVLEVEIRPYQLPEDCTLDIVQPLLELLGIIFQSSTGCFSLTEQVIEDWSTKSSVLDEGYQLDKAPSYNESTMAAIGERILKFMLYHRHDSVRGDAGNLDKDLVKYAVAMLMTKAKAMEKAFKPLTLKIKHLNQLIDDALMVPHGDLLNNYPSLLPVLRLIAADKFLTWFGKEIVELNAMKKNPAKALDVLNRVTTFDDAKRLEKISEKVFKLVDKCAPRVLDETTSYLRNPNSSISTLQLHLYANIQRARIMTRHNDMLQKMIAMEILEQGQEQVDALRRNLTNFVAVVKQGMQEVVVMMMVRDSENENSNNFIPELPRLGTLALALQITVDFLFMGINSHLRSVVIEATERVFEACENYQKRLKDLTIRTDEREQDVLDLQFLLDLIIGLIATNEMTIICNEQYKELVRRGAELFPCETKYFKLFTEINCGSIFKSIKLEQVVGGSNQKLLKRRLERFDPTLDRQLLMNSLSLMLSMLKISEHRGDCGKQMVFQKFKQEALILHEPAVWRLVIKAAARIGKKALENDAYVRAQGQCVWSTNIHLDFCEGMGEPEPNKITPASKTILRMLESKGGCKVFIDDDTILDTIWEIAQQRKEFQTDDLHE